VTISPDSRYFVTVADTTWFKIENGIQLVDAMGGGVDLWDMKTGKRIRRVSDSPSKPALYAHDGSLILTGATRAALPSAAGGPDTIIQEDTAAVDPLTGSLIREFGSSDRPDGWLHAGYAVALSADGKVFFKTTGVGEVHAFEVATGQFRAAWGGHKGTLFCLAAPAFDVRRLVSGADDTTALVWDVGFASGVLNPLTPERRLALWGDLTETDAQKAYAAMRVLAADPAGFVTVARERLPPTPPGPTAAELADIFRDLRSAIFSTREAAGTKLDRFGESAVAQVRAQFEKEESPEVRARLLVFLSRHGKTPLRTVRAIELLEHLGTPEAKGLLATLAAGGPSGQTADAARALERLRQRP
jgi:hypothetical protein